MAPSFLYFQVSLGDSLRLMPAEQLQAHKLPAKYIADDLDSSETTIFPENLVFILNHLVPMLSCDRGSFLERRSISSTAYKLLSHVMDKVVECQESSHEKEGSMQIAAAYKARAKVVVAQGAEAEDKDEDAEDDGDIEEMCELPRRITDQVCMSKNWMAEKSGNVQKTDAWVSSVQTFFASRNHFKIKML